MICVQEDQLYQEIGQRVRQLRRRAQLTQEQLSERAGISPSFLGHIERGTRKMSVATLHHLSQALDCAPGTLMGDAAETDLPLLLTMAARALAERPAPQTHNQKHPND